MATSAKVAVSPQARLTYLGISPIIRGQRRSLISSSCCPSSHRRQQLSTSRRRRDSGPYFRSDFANQGFTGEYIPHEQTAGPLKAASSTGAPRITPKLLKDHLDQFVVGQDRAKKALATAVYNHYQRIQELQRREEEEEDRIAQEERRRMSELRRHPVEDEWPGQQLTINMPAPGSSAAQQNNGLGPPPLVDDSPLTIEKSNILLLGPSGVGKTLMAKTLARVLEVPFSLSDCTPFTQAGYIGEDAEVCVQRLLAAANYDVTRAERGIICLDEIDKIATAKVSHGKDVSGEGVQQALLKIIEGTTLQIQAKQERGSSTGSAGGRSQGGYPTNSPLSGGTMSGGGQQTPSSGGGQRGETYNVKTDNILFICAGAFNGLHKQILDRVSKGSIGFGATVRARPGSSEDSNVHETIVEGEDELFEKHLPYYAPDESTQHTPDGQKKKRTFNTLDLVEPQDLQKYGLIPELVGRIPLSCALSSLDIESLVKVLTEPRNSLLQQYKQLFALSSIELRITSSALRSIASTAAKMATGARGLRTVMERLLADAMFETPGSGVKYVLITEDVAERKAGAMYFYRGELGRFQQVAAAEEEAWEERLRREWGDGESEWERRGRVNSEGGAATTFEEYRQKATAAGFV
ncbi:P-loop containing nucleoside triphosphate hydrolase protein [Teratosphaeria nubilosa]|uniref:P-loop containing nucleoside triphosphate hydrolase protein n=1 Tax=Teratosphaeria nubilosa TaxID=161662 RepID=A0A6G1L3P2_9PEZI|nr:P-loop containing nucleoside triphosphate hydrolase protein [Teratosphaeria nubilosa]